MKPAIPPWIAGFVLAQPTLPRVLRSNNKNPGTISLQHVNTTGPNGLEE
jgi:hypothetical protein